MSNDSLIDALSAFRGRLNGNPRVRSLLKGWDRDISVEATDSNSQAVMVLRNSHIENFTDAPSKDAVLVTVRATEELLCAVFSGKANPTTLFLDGTLQVFASDRDQVKLDALSLLLWE